MFCCSSWPMLAASSGPPWAGDYPCSAASAWAGTAAYPIGSASGLESHSCCSWPCQCVATALDPLETHLGYGPSRRAARESSLQKRHMDYSDLKAWADSQAASGFASDSSEADTVAHPFDSASGSSEA